MTKMKKEIGGYECPKCGSDNSETYLKEREQHCLDCGYDWILNENLAKEMEEL